LPRGTKARAGRGALIQPTRSARDGDESKKILPSNIRKTAESGIAVSGFRRDWAERGSAAYEVGFVQTPRRGS